MIGFIRRNGVSIALLLVGVSILIGAYLVARTRTQAQAELKATFSHAEANLQSTFAQAEIGLRRLVVGECRRLNVKQVEDNRSQRADFVYDKTFLALVTLPGHRTRKQRRLIAEFTKPLIAAEHTKSWVPLVPNCSDANANFKPPQAVPFYLHPAPKSALTYPSLK